ncbi:MAG: DUF938 domain-containing protein [Arenicellales bacterium]
MQDKPFSQACENNKAPILEVLQTTLSTANTVLEVGSGTGQHALHFAQNLPHLIWQTSDRAESHAGILQWLSDANLSNVLPPLAIDVQTYAWGEQAFDGVFTANTLHIMSEKAAEHFIKNVAKALNTGGKFIAYGPFNYNGEFTSESNARFELWLKQQNPLSGIRDFEALDALAKASGMQLLDDHEMPANNRVLVWQKA